MIGKILIVTADADGIVTFVNPNCEALLSHCGADLEGRPLWHCVIVPDVAERMRNAIECLRRGGEAVEDEGAWRSKSGHAVVIRWGYTALRDARGELQSIILAGYDVGRSQSITAELGESLDRYQALLDTAVDGIISIDEKGLVESFNRAAERIFGYRASEVIGRNVSMLMPSPYREEHGGYLNNYLTTRRKKIIGIGREVDGQRKDGTTFPMDLAVGEVITVHGRIFTGIVRDISDRKAAEAEARRRMNELAHVMRLRSMGELASGLAHEVNQPLTAIITSAQACMRMLRNGNADSGLMLEVQEQIAHQGERAAEVIRRLRKYVEKGELEKAPSDLNQSVIEVLNLLSHELRAHRVKTYIDTAEGLPLVSVDRIQIEQVLVNLVRNAVEAMSEDEVEPDELYITTRAEALLNATGVAAAVRDNGPGISAEIANRLFEPYVTTKPKGLGQGLSICRRIIEAHGGRLWTEPAQPRGAEFRIWLPAAESA
jgi:two-component system sensor kinase FixL